MFRIISIIIFFSFTQISIAKQVYTMEKVALQMAMFKHIEESLIDGVFPHVTLLDGSVTNLVPTKAHPMILTFGERYVLCTDFRDPNGKFINVDFYLAPNGASFNVIQTEIDNRDKLDNLMRAGKVKLLK